MPLKLKFWKAPPPEIPEVARPDRGNPPEPSEPLSESTEPVQKAKKKGYGDRVREHRDRRRETHFPKPGGGH
jgi:hypothetical protein